MVLTQRCSRCRRDKSLDQFHDEVGTGFTTCITCRQGNRKARQLVKEKLNKISGGPERLQKPEPSSEPEIDIEVVVPPPDPLLEVQQQWKERQEKNTVFQHRDALLEENHRLKWQLEQFQEAWKPPEIIVYDKPSWVRSDAIAVVNASDWHVEEIVEKDSVHGLNEFNPDIAKERAAWFFQNALQLTDIVARDSVVKTIQFNILGDTTTGWIHEELMAATAMAPGAAAKFCKDLFVSGLEFWLRESEYNIDIDAIPGNHGRMTKKMHFTDPTGTSLETFMYGNIADYFRNEPRIRMNVSKKSMVFKTFFEDLVIRLIHGYEVKYNGGVGGITIPINKAINEWNKAIWADITIMGHWHQKLDGEGFMVNGSLIGYNTFAQQIKAAFEEARQLFFAIHARKGGEKSIVAPIWLDGVHAQELEVIDG